MVGLNEVGEDFWEVGSEKRFFLLDNEKMREGNTGGVSKAMSPGMVVWTSNHSGSMADSHHSFILLGQCTMRDTISFTLCEIFNGTFVGQKNYKDNKDIYIFFYS